MDIRTVVKERRSIRRFKPDPVSEALVREILDEARWAPSWGNTQPWEFYVLTGDALKIFKKANAEKFDLGESIAPDIPMAADWIAPLKARYNGIGKSMLKALDIRRDDAERRNLQSRAMYEIFDAPCLILGCIDQRHDSHAYAMFDLGLITQTLCLLAHDRGLGTCLLACAVRFPLVLRGLLPNAGHKLFAIGIAVGYPEREAAVNAFERERAPIEELVTWVE